MKPVLFALVVIAVGVSEIESSQEVLKKISSSFLRVLDDCKKEQQITEDVLQELYTFWKEENALPSRGTGCAIVCMSKKLDIVDESGKLHHGNAKDFAVEHGASEEVAMKLITLVHDCEKQHDGVADECLRALDVAKCFKEEMKKLNWTPDMDVAVGEILSEV